MPEQKRIKVETTYIQSGGVLQSRTSFEGTVISETGELTLLPNIIPPIGGVNNIKSGAGQQDTVNYDEGDLVLAIKGELLELHAEINKDGDLIIHAEDAKRYAINDDGDLIYDFTIPVYGLR